jgi:hypothetical protein
VPFLDARLVRFKVPHITRMLWIIEVGRFRA